MKIKGAVWSLSKNNDTLWLHHNIKTVGTMLSKQRSGSADASCTIILFSLSHTVMLLFALMFFYSFFWGGGGGEGG